MRPLRPIALAAGAMLACEAAADAPLSYLHTEGAAADPVTRLGWGLGAIAIIVVIAISVFLLLAILRSRGRDAPRSSSPAPVERDAAGLRIVYVGTGISAVVLFACAIWTLNTLAQVARAPAQPAFTIEVTAHQWWWELRYLDPQPARIFTTANEIHIPVGQPVRFALHSEDVIHSFWIPRLAGKTDVIPGQVNQTWLEASHAGVYRGQCAEYCGLQHAHMALVVVADAPADFARWRDAQLAEARPAAAAVLAGHDVFKERCAACHTVRGGQTGGIIGPDLTHVMSRGTLAAATLPNDPGTLKAWIADAPAFKPGTRMPALKLPDGELTAVAAYVQTLK
ncbi:MAG TPA: cytochrome c oxidase subunit II [Burkholderiales bacterium]|nr:cytochrome c oxidase subunit II [Burkholderiales bacterium]